MVQPWTQLLAVDYMAVSDPHADVGHCSETSHLVADKDRRSSLKRQGKGGDISVTTSFLRNLQRTLYILIIVVVLICRFRCHAAPSDLQAGG